jgi:uncharacterized membrane protein
MILITVSGLLLLIAVVSWIVAGAGAVVIIVSLIILRLVLKLILALILVLLRILLLGIALLLVFVCFTHRGASNWTIAAGVDEEIEQLARIYMADKNIVNKEMQAMEWER